MRLWLPEKASARLSIKGFFGAGCIFPRHRVDVSQARRVAKGLYIRSLRCFTRRNRVWRDVRNHKGDDAWLSVMFTFVRSTNFSISIFVRDSSQSFIRINKCNNYRIDHRFIFFLYFNFFLMLSLFLASITTSIGHLFGVLICYSRISSGTRNYWSVKRIDLLICSY